jgi:SagB-type dehydrogenase family enzyme
MRRVVLTLLAGIVFSVVAFEYAARQQTQGETPAAAGGELITLPPPRPNSSQSVEECLKSRRSVREYADRPLSLFEVSQLLWSAQGVTSLSGGRTAPSAGATYPLEVYLVAGEVEGIAAGVYSYLPSKHALSLVSLGDLREELAGAVSGQRWVGEAPAVLLITGVFGRTTGRYGDRGVRYVHMEAGHAAENVYLQSCALSLGTVTVGAFSDDGVREVMKLSNAETPLYLMPIGGLGG